MTEKQLIAGCKNKDNNARKYLYEQYARKMFALCLRYVNDYEVAQDILQDGFLKIFERIDSFSSHGSLEGWMRRIFVNTALDFLRKQKICIRTEDFSLLVEIDEEEEVCAGVSDLSEEILLSILQQLPLGYATVFNLLVIEEYSPKEVAAMLCITEGGVRSQYARARKLLQKMIENYQERNR